MAFLMNLHAMLSGHGAEFSFIFFINPSPPVLIFIRQSLNVQSFYLSGST